MRLGMIDQKAACPKSANERAPTALATAGKAVYFRSPLSAALSSRSDGRYVAKSAIRRSRHPEMKGGLVPCTSVITYLTLHTLALNDDCEQGSS